jgi:YVTN family beta-propeller protein
MTIGLGRTLSAFALAATGAMIVMAPAQPAWPGVVAPAGGPHVVATIGLDRQPDDIATDPVTGMVYVGEPFKLVVINGKTNTVAGSVHVPDKGFGVVTDSANGMVYVSDPAHAKVLVISEKTGTVVTSIKVGGGAFFMAVNPVANRIYAQAIVSGTLGRLVVIDGRTNKVVAGVPDHNGSAAVAVNPVTDTIYVSDNDSLLVISGQTNKVTGTIPGIDAFGLATDPRTDTVYASLPSADGPGVVYVINGKTGSLTTTVPASGVLGLAVDRLTDMVYGAVFDPNTATVIDGRTNKVVANVPVGSHPRNVAVNQRTNTIYTTNTGDNSVSVIAGAG